MPVRVRAIVSRFVRCPAVSADRNCITLEQYLAVSAGTIVVAYVVWQSVPDIKTITKLLCPAVNTGAIVDSYGVRQSVPEL